MFTQRNNPYCDLLKISVAKILYFLVIRKFYRIFLLFLQKIYPQGSRKGEIA